MPQGWIRSLALALLALPLAAFFGFVGWYKAFATLAQLAQHNAFTVHLPVWLGKGLGWFEMAGALALVAGTVTRRAGRAQLGFALALAIEQIVSSLIHWRFGETSMLAQNGLLIAMLIAIVALERRTSSSPSGA